MSEYDEENDILVIVKDLLNSYFEQLSLIAINKEHKCSLMFATESILHMVNRKYIPGYAELHLKILLTEDYDELAKDILFDGKRMDWNEES